VEKQQLIHLYTQHKNTHATPFQLRGCLGVLHGNFDKCNYVSQFTAFTVTRTIQ